MSAQWVLPRGTAAEQDFEVAIRPGERGLAHTGLLVAELAPEQTRRIATGDCEYIVLVLAGEGIEIDCAGRTERLAGRTDVFAGAADAAYLPRRTEFSVRSESGARVAFCHALATADLPISVVRAEQVEVELRGAGECSRQVHNFGTPGVLEASSLIACEVITPAGNWSSYPPHKHDERRPGVEAELEEIYYFAHRAEAGAPADADPMGYQCVYGTRERPIDVRAQVRSGDVVLVPHGWHGPAMAAPGYHMYYLNVMAGPGPERTWLICDDPAHTWVREGWATQPMDPRLPLAAP